MVVEKIVVARSTVVVQAVPDRVVEVVGTIAEELDGRPASALESETGGRGRGQRNSFEPGMKK